MTSLPQDIIEEKEQAAGHDFGAKATTEATSTPPSSSYAVHSTTHSYREVAAWPLTSGTSCYSSARGGMPRQVESDTATTVTLTAVDLATERHVVSLQVPCSFDDYDAAAATSASADGNTDRKTPHVSWREILGESVRRRRRRQKRETSLVCVGYTQSGDWEAIVLIDRTQVPLDHGGSKQAPPNVETVDDTATVVTSTSATTAASMSQTEPIHHRHRRTPSGSLSFDGSLSQISVTAQSVLTLPSNDALLSGDAPVTAGGTSGAETVTGNAVIVDGGGGTFPTSAESNVAEREESLMAELVLHNKETYKTYRTQLDFRPLTPVLCAINDRVGIWLGSSDHNKLQFWQPDQPGDRETHFVGSLRSVELQDEAFQFDSPVMALDCVPNETDEGYWLAVGCQDGTIRIIALGLVAGESQTLLPSSVSETTVIVDGPIVCITLQRREIKHGGPRVLVGSLCGYVCEMILSNPRTQTSADEWEGPKMVAEGFWNARLHAEDSVLAVCAPAHNTQDGRVAIGTHAGRCKVYDTVDGKYELHWECQLPYPVHGLALLSSPDQVVVTTRKSLHLFRAEKRSYNAESAKQRLLSFAEALGIKEAPETEPTQPKAPEKDAPFVPEETA